MIIQKSSQCAGNNNPPNGNRGKVVAELTTMQNNGVTGGLQSQFKVSNYSCCIPLFDSINDVTVSSSKIFD